MAFGRHAEYEITKRPSSAVDEPGAPASSALDPVFEAATTEKYPDCTAAWKVGSGRVRAWLAQ